MLILCSDGITSKALSDRVSREIKNKNMQHCALVVTADNEYKEHNYHVARCIRELESMNLMVDIFDLDRQPASQLLDYDVVEFIGGNPYYLLHSIRTHQCKGILLELSRKKLLIGWSAADFVFGPTLDLVDQYSPQMNFPGLTDLSGITLTQFHVLPHYSKFLKKFEQFEEKCSYFEKKHNSRVIRLNDGDGLILDGDQYEIIHCQPIIEVLT